MPCGREHGKTSGSLAVSRARSRHAVGGDRRATPGSRAVSEVAECDGGRGRERYAAGVDRAARVAELASQRLARIVRTDLMVLAGFRGVARCASVERGEDSAVYWRWFDDEHGARYARGPVSRAC